MDLNARTTRFLGKLPDKIGIVPPRDRTACDRPSRRLRTSTLACVAETVFNREDESNGTDRRDLGDRSSFTKRERDTSGTPGESSPFSSLTICYKSIGNGPVVAVSVALINAPNVEIDRVCSSLPRR